MAPFKNIAEVNRWYRGCMQGLGKIGAWGFNVETKTGIEPEEETRNAFLASKSLARCVRHAYTLLGAAKPPKLIYLEEEIFKRADWPNHSNGPVPHNPEGEFNDIKQADNWYARAMIGLGKIGALHVQAGRGAGKDPKPEMFHAQQAAKFIGASYRHAYNALGVAQRPRLISFRAAVGRHLSW